MSEIIQRRSGGYIQSLHHFAILYEPFECIQILASWRGNVLKLTPHRHWGTAEFANPARCGGTCMSSQHLWGWAGRIGSSRPGLHSKTPSQKKKEQKIWIDTSSMKTGDWQMSRCLSSSIIREMQIKTMVRETTHILKWLKLENNPLQHTPPKSPQNLSNTKLWCRGEQLELSYISGKQRNTADAL
jgi:hypothetical protein